MQPRHIIIILFYVVVYVVYELWRSTSLGSLVASPGAAELQHGGKLGIFSTSPLAAFAAGVASGVVLSVGVYTCREPLRCCLRNASWQSGGSGTKAGSQEV